MDEHKFIITFNNFGTIVEGRGTSEDLLNGITTLTSGLLKHEPDLKIDDICDHLREEFKEGKNGGRIN